MPFGICYQESLDNSSFGAQRHVVMNSGPGVKNTFYPRLIDLPAMADGTYYARLCIGGLSKLNLQLKATFGVGTVTISAVTTLAPIGTDDDPTLFAKSLQVFAGTGALVTNTLQTSTIAATQGEQIAVLKIVVAGGAAPVFTVAELNGPR